MGDTPDPEGVPQPNLGFLTLGDYDYEHDPDSDSDPEGNTLLLLLVTLLMSYFVYLVPFVDKSFISL